MYESCSPRNGAIDETDGAVSVSGLGYLGVFAG
jgi:hypothetical protein